MEVEIKKEVADDSDCVYDEEQQLDVVDYFKSESESECDGLHTFSTPDAGKDPLAPDIVIWTEHVNLTRGNLLNSNIIQTRPGEGPSPEARSRISLNSPLSAFQLIFDNSMIKTIVDNSNEHCQESNLKINFEVTDILKYIALSYARGVLGLTAVPIRDCWDELWGPKIFSHNMSRERYLSIMRLLRFDQKSTRNERLQHDKFAKASNIWCKMIANSQSHYNNGTSLGVFKHLYQMNCTCPFIQHLPNKHNIGGLVYWFLADLKSQYILNGLPYLGQSLLIKNQTTEEHGLMQLLKPYYGSKVNVTCQNQCPPINFAEELKRNGISIVGPINKSCSDIPDEILTKNPLHSTRAYCNQFGHTLTNYQSKVNSNVLILSTLHSRVWVSNSRNKNPDTVLYYNSNSAIIDNIHGSCQKYTTRTLSRRWLNHVFCTILDIAGFNSWILYKEVLNVDIGLREFLVELVDEILASECRRFLPPMQMEPLRSDKRRRCVFKKCGNKSSYCCSVCKKVTCGKCAKVCWLCKVCDAKQT